MITAEKLARFVPSARPTAAAHAEALEAARHGSSLNTTRRVAAFLGQIFVETGGFTAMVENLNYKDPARLDGLFRAVNGLADARALIDRGPAAIANRVYANRIGNGNEASGDGWRYRGSGHKQLTGRANYKEIGRLVGLDLEGTPELAREIKTSALVAVRFWDARKCSDEADAGDIEGVTRLINGPGLAGLAERRKATDRALRIWA
jgi:putative chitinase